MHGLIFYSKDYLSLLSSISVMKLFKINEFVPNGSIKIITVGSVLFSLVFNMELAW